MKTETERGPSRFKRGPVLGAIGAAIVLVASAIIPTAANAAPAPEGEYVGTTTQILAYDEPVENWEGYDYSPETWVQDFSFSVDENSNLVDVSGQFWWVCVVPGSHINYDYADMADSDEPITGSVEVGEPFTITAINPGFEYTLEGIIHEDGTSEGFILAELGFCGASLMEWSTVNDDVPDPEPTEVTAVEPEREGNTITIPVVEGITYVDDAGEELTGDIVLTEGQTLTVTATADEGYELAPGTTVWEYTYESQVIEVTAVEPDFEDNIVSIPVVEGVTYVDDAGEELTGDIVLTEGQTLVVFATADEGYELAPGATEWTYTYESTDPELIEVDAVEPGFEDNVVSIPEVEGVIYSDADGDILTGDIELTEGQTLTVNATADEGYELAPGATSWEYTYEPADPEVIEVEAVEPTRTDNTVTIPVVEGVTYVDGNGDVLTGDIELIEGQTLIVTATADEGYELAPGATSWEYTYEPADPEVIEVEAVEPTRTDNTVTIPEVEGVLYVDGSTGEVLTGDVELVEGVTLVVNAIAEEGYELAPGTTSWEYTHEATDPELIEVTAVEPGFEDNIVTIPDVEGVIYTDADGVVLDGEVHLTEGTSITVIATADEGYVLADGATSWEYAYESTDPDPEPEVVEAEEPGRNGNIITLPEIEGVYYVDGDGNVLTGTVELVEGESITISAVAEEGYVLADGATSWTFEYATSDDEDGTDDNGNGTDEGDDEDRLPDTGAAGAGIAAALASLLIAAGAGFLLMRRRNVMEQ
ncbi:InlB B-repeat-containing protein [Microbacterium sp. YY-01]|uniref:InlB B-repeat-containing protein n=1 Tax=Microbacterium sp. YY-01 TaxID=3421634 RepID=UPI003D16CF87